MPITRILTDTDAQLLTLAALDDHVRGSLLRDLEAAGFDIERVDARIADWAALWAVDKMAGSVRAHLEAQQEQFDHGT